MKITTELDNISLLIGLFHDYFLSSKCTLFSGSLVIIHGEFAVCCSGYDCLPLGSVPLEQGCRLSIVYGLTALSFTPASMEHPQGAEGRTAVHCEKAS